MPGRHKTDHLEAKGLAPIRRNGSLPEVWIPPAKLLDLRDLMRTPLACASKAANGSVGSWRLAALWEFAITMTERIYLRSVRLKTLPDVGTILGSTIYLDIGELEGFAEAAHLASYADTLLGIIWALPQTPEFCRFGRNDSSRLASEKSGPLERLPLHSGPDRCSVRSPTWTYPLSGCSKCTSI